MSKNNNNKWIPRQGQTIPHKTGRSKTTKENSTNNQMRNRQEDFDAKYGNGKIIKKSRLYKQHGNRVANAKGRS